MKNVNKLLMLLLFFGCVAGEIDSHKPIDIGPLQTVASINPNQSNASGGVDILITGQNFRSGSDVFVGTQRCQNVEVLNATSIRCRIPPSRVLGTIIVRVIDPDQREYTFNSGVTYTAPNPSIATVQKEDTSLANRELISISGGERIIISGSNFYLNSIVEIDGVACSNINYVDINTITCITPSSTNTGQVDVVVENGDGKSITGANELEYTNPPNLTSIQQVSAPGVVSGPTSGGTNMQLIITDTTATNINQISIVFGSGTNVAPCNLVSRSSNTYVCTTSSHNAGTTSVTITDLNTNISNTIANIFNYRSAPTITSVLNEQSRPFANIANATNIQIRSTGLFTENSVSPRVTIGGTPCNVTNITYATTNNPVDVISCTAPTSTAGAKDVLVINPDLQQVTATNAITYTAAPTLTRVADVNTNSISPVSGNYPVTLTGTNFTGGIEVIIDPGTNNSSNCSNTIVVNNTSATCTIPSYNPAHAAGNSNIRVVNTNTGLSVDLANAIEFKDSPTITSVISRATDALANVTYGALAGGYNISITGTNFFTSGSTNPNVTIDGVACTFVSSTATEIVCTTPARTAGTKTLVVTNPDGQTINSSWTYRPAPTFASINENLHPISGGSNLVINGDNFSNVNGTPRVIVDYGTGIGNTNSPCTAVTFVSANRISCTMPAHVAGVVSLRVLNSDGQLFDVSSAITYTTPPTITNFTPTAGVTSGGTAITITGTGFFIGSTVTVGTYPCNIANRNTDITSTSIICTTTAGVAGNYNITVTNSSVIRVVSAGTFSYQAPPTITRVHNKNLATNLSAGPIGGATVLTITGTNFTSPDITAAVIDPDGTPATCSIDTSTLTSTEFECTTATHAAGIFSMRITRANGQTATISNAFTYRPNITIANITPNSGSTVGSTILTISGANFISGMTVTLDPTGTAAACTVASIDTTANPNTIRCTTTTHTAGTVDVLVEYPEDFGTTSSNAFTYVAPPSISSLNVTSGDATGGTTVVISGSNFDDSLGNLTVLFGTTACNIANRNTDITSTSITCTTTAHNLHQAVDVVVTNSDGQSATSANGFNFRLPPTITSIISTNNINYGRASGGDTITITGSRFYSGLTINIGALACGSINIVDAETVRCTTPAATAGVYNITVTNDIGQTVTLNNGWTYTNPPTITTVTPSQGSISGGTNILITGTNFDTANPNDISITLGTETCTRISSNATTITCRTSSSSAGVVNVVIENPDGQTAVLALGFTYRATPTITTVSPNNGYPFGEDTITITGTNFFTPMTVLIGSNNCTGVTVVNTTTIRCTTPSGTAGTFDITVRNSLSQSATLANSFTYLSGYTISWDTRSPNPPNPDNFGSPNTNVIHRYVLRNPGNQATPPITIGIGGTHPTAFNIISGLNTCSGASIAPNSQCNVSVAYLGATNPPGTYTGRLTASVARTGGGIITRSIDMNASTSSLAFNTTAPNPPNPSNYGSTTSNVARTYVLVNNGGGTTPAISLTLTGTDAASFTILNDNCSSTTLSAGTSCNFDIRYNGATNTAGTHNANIVATAGALSATNALVGTTSPIAATLSLTPASHDYGTTSTNVSQNFTLSNTGNQATQNITVSLTGADPSAFSLGTNTCTGTLGAYGTCSIQVDYLGASNSAGATYTATLQATDGTLTDTSNLTGTNP